LVERDMNRDLTNRSDRMPASEAAAWSLRLAFLALVSMLLQFPLRNLSANDMGLSSLFCISFFLWTGSLVTSLWLGTSALRRASTGPSADRVRRLAGAGLLVCVLQLVGFCAFIAQRGTLWS
jgi:hypothetical protein